MTEAYPSATIVPDLYILKSGVSIDVRDILALTGNTVNGRAEVDKMSGSYTTDKVIGESANKIDADYADREIAVAIHGALVAKVANDVAAGQSLMGAGSQFTEDFSGDGSAQQEIQLLRTPVDSVVSVTEDPTGTPTVLTEVSGTPTTGQYSIDKDTGIITIGGTSVSGTDNYQVIYNWTTGGLTPMVDSVKETVAVSTNVGSITEEAEVTELNVEVTAGTTTGGFVVITEGTPASAEVLYDASAKTLTFAAGDAVTSCVATYKTTYKSCARALESKSAGSLCRHWFSGVKY